MITTAQQLKAILEQEFTPTHLDIIDESHLHAGHMGYIEGVSTHFNVTIVSEVFEGLMPIKQHRLVNTAVKELLDGPIHALALKTIKPSNF
jgi:BolA family transcriptional regulator, general stress-responsive regulator